MRGGMDAVELGLMLFGLSLGVPLIVLAFMACPLAWGVAQAAAGVALVVGCTVGAIRCHRDRNDHVLTAARPRLDHFELFVGGRDVTYFYAAGSTPTYAQRHDGERGEAEA